MPLEIVDHGCDNSVDIDPETGASLAGRITFAGSRNRVRLAQPFIAQTIQVEMGEDCRLDVEEGCHAGILAVHMRGGGSLSIGRRSSFNGLTRLLLHEPGRIAIGAECLFGPDIDVTVSDMHSILDRKTGRRLNPARDVVIADRVWLGIGVFVGKGARIDEGAMVGARSFVSGHVAAHTVVAGNPVRRLRENVSWTFDLV